MFGANRVLRRTMYILYKWSLAVSYMTIESSIVIYIKSINLNQLLYYKGNFIIKQKSIQFNFFVI